MIVIKNLKPQSTDLEKIEFFLTYFTIHVQSTAGNSSAAHSSEHSTTQQKNQNNNKSAADVSVARFQFQLSKNFLSYSIPAQYLSYSNYNSALKIQVKST